MVFKSKILKIHLIRMAAGIASLGELRQRQLDRISKSGKSGKLYAFTRNMPKKVNELTEGGSIYWVIKRFIRARQMIISIEKQTNEEGRAFCAIHLDTELVPVMPRRQKSFQGWRYYKDEETPSDIDRSGASNFEDIPPEMVQELKELCLI